MKSIRKGIRHPLLMYRRTMDRVWKYTFVLAIALAASGWWSMLEKTEILGMNSDIWIFATALLAFFVSVFAFLTRYFAFVQAREAHLRVATPFLRLKISYQRIRSVHPGLVQQIFPPEESSWAQRSFLEPFYGKTGLVIELRGFPIDPRFLRLFLPKQMFSPHSKGLVILVPDWMKLSTEIDSFYGAWLQIQGARLRKSRVS